MPSHSARVRTAPLPKGYQFGDARPPAGFAYLPWRPPHVNAAEQLARRGWNVIEGEHFDSDEERPRTIEGAES